MSENYDPSKQNSIPLDDDDSAAFKPIFDTYFLKVLPFQRVTSAVRA